MPEKLITIPFNHNDFFNTQRVAWSFSFKKALKSYTFYTLLPIVLLTAGILFDSIFSDIIGGLLLFYISTKWFEVYSARKKYFKRMHDYAKRLSEEKTDCIYEFSEKYLKYEDSEKLYRLNWSVFNSFSVFKNVIMITGKDSGAVIFSINKASTGEKDFNDIKEILSEKIPVNTINN